ncbi:MAG: hypothetical protein ABIS36_11380 [Chryseolinea sp.]
MKAITLQNVLRVNAASSGATGLLLVIFSDTVKGLFDVSITWPFSEVGIFLIAFATIVFYVSRINPINQLGIRIILTLDSLWVASSIVLIMLHPFEISFVGNALIAAVALWVALMVYLQFIGSRNYHDTAR